MYTVKNDISDIKINQLMIRFLFKTEHKATDLIKYKHKIFVDYLQEFRQQ